MEQMYLKDNRPIEVSGGLEFNEEMLEKLQKILTSNPYMRYIGLEIEKLGPEFAQGIIPYRDEVINPYGGLHGSAIYAIADIVSGFAACAHGNFHSTVGGTMNYLMPANDTAYIRCKAFLMRKGSRLAVYRVEIANDKDELIADGSFTFYEMKKKFEI